MNFTRASIFMGVFGVSYACILAACVGDAPTSSVGATDDGSVSGDSGSTFTCSDAAPQVFSPGPKSLGVFCGPNTNASNPSTSHCNLGESCCLPTGAARACAPTCTGAGGDLQCGSAQDCSGFDAGGPDAAPLVCCTEPDVTVDTTTCSYPFFTSLHHSFCQTQCAAGAKQLCQTPTECGALSCVGATTPYPGYGLALCQ